MNRVGWIEHHFNNMYIKPFSGLSTNIGMLPFPCDVKSHNIHDHTNDQFGWASENIHHSMTNDTKFTIDSESCETSSILSVCDPCKAPMTQLGWCQFQQSPGHVSQSRQKSIQDGHAPSVKQLKNWPVENFQTQLLNIIWIHLAKTNKLTMLTWR